MAYQRMGRQRPDYLPVRYAGSRLVFRGPRRGLAGGYVACLGGTGTHGTFVDRPWPAPTTPTVRMSMRPALSSLPRTA